MLLQAIDQPFHSIPCPICLAIEERVRRLVGTARNDRDNTAVLQIAANRPAAVPLVARQSSGPYAWPANTGTLDRSGFHQPGQKQLLVALASGKGEDQRLTAALRANVNPCAEAARLRPNAWGLLASRPPAPG